MIVRGVPGANPLNDRGDAGAGEEEGEMVVDRQGERAEGPMLGPYAVEVDGPEQEVIMVNDVRLTQESALRELRLACRFLGISKNGSKATVWNRLKREVALAKLKVAVEASEIVKAEYARELLVNALPERPSEELVLIHETTHIPKAPWCEACVASRSREDNYDDTEPHREFPVVSMDYMFTATQDNPLATHLILVDSQTKFVQATAIDGKGNRSLKYCVEDVVRLMNSLGYQRIGLRYDTRLKMGMRHIVQIAVKGIFIQYVPLAIACCRQSSNTRDTRLRVKTHFSLGPTGMRLSLYLGSQF